MATASVDRGRITARVPVEVQKMLEIAAGMVRATLDQFIVQTALREAERVIERERVIRLSERGADAFLSALDNPPPPKEDLMAALQDSEGRRDHQTGALDWTPRPKRV
jgi:uncharacterized protein (DUF1778 family)